MKKDAMRQRNAAICEFYKTGASPAQCGKRFGLKHLRVKQIVKAAGIWRERPQHESNERDAFLGIDISTDDKEALLIAAARTNTSMSALSSKWIREKLANLHPPLTNDEKIAFYEARLKKLAESLEEAS